MSAVGLMAALFLGACRDNPLDVTNPNNPDVERAFGTARDVESIASKVFQQMWNGQHFVSDNIGNQTITMSFESSSQLGNFGMGSRGAIPRGGIDNSIGNAVASGNFRDFDHLSRNARSAATAIIRLNEFIAAGAGTGTPARDARARSFSFFALGYALGQLAAIYDSAAIITPAVAPTDIPDLSHFTAVNAAALAMLDSALAISSSAAATTGGDGWPIPADWMSLPSGGVTVDLVRWRQIVRSYKAKFRAGVARTPAERAAVDWAAVIADAENGITSDFIIEATVVGGWRVLWIQQLRVAATWSQMTPMILGMADTSGGYTAWLAQPLNQRTPFLLHTPDRRFPAGATREAQTEVSGGSSRAGPGAGSDSLYFRNRPSGEDVPAEPWGTWFYDNHRFWHIGQGGGNGPFAAVPVAEVDMLAAEGHLRAGNAAAAAALIDKTRTAKGLPSVAGLAVQGIVPGGAGCVPRVPVATGGTTCGNLIEAMKYEKRMETAFAGYASWFIDSRGWGDLWQGTPVHWPVPYQEIFARYGVITPYTTTELAACGGGFGMPYGFCGS